MTGTQTCWEVASASLSGIVLLWLVGPMRKTQRCPGKSACDATHGRG